MKRPSQQDRGFILGILFAAWHLNRVGEDTYAEELMESAGSVSEFQRLARREGYSFRRGFWAAAYAREARRSGK